MSNPRPVLPDFEYILPDSPEAAAAFLREHPDNARLLLGGTDLFVQMRDRKFTPQYLLDIKGLEGMDRLDFNAIKGLMIGAAVNMNRLIANQDVREYYPLIIQSAREVGSYQLRTRATLVGNLCNASPSGDTIAPCLVYGGKAHILGPKGERAVLLADFFTGPGSTVLEPGEFITTVELPLPPVAAVGAYRSIGRNALGDLAIVASTVLGWPDQKAESGFSFHIALSAVAPTVIFVPEAEMMLGQGPIDKQLLQKAARIAAGASRPISDIRASENYRREMVGAMTLQALEFVWDELGRQKGGKLW